MFQSILMMGGLGVAIGAVLVIASKAFYVYEDPKVVAIDDALPGANCGGCGYPGCNANAQAIADGISGVNSCVAAGEDVAMAIADIMGVSVSDQEPEFAGPGCYYSKDEADMEYRYQGVTDCRAASMLFGGMKVCRIGCLGLGTCVKACMFGALSIGTDGLPKVNQEKCTGCGACERICPKNIIRLTSVTRRIMREYTREECITPCQRACPTGIDIKEYIRLIRQGDYEGSVQVIKERNPFPTVISRICPAPCESNCRRLMQDESVGINHLKRFVCDYEMTRNKRVLPYKAPETGKKVAIIGGGVEGLSTAFFAARLGHSPTVFEATEDLGGILRKAITRERLPMEVLDWDIEGVKEMGVDIQTQSTAGNDISIDGLLKEGFEAVFTATGGWDSRLARKGIDHAETVFPGAYLLIDLLRSKSDDKIRVPSGKNVVMAGGWDMMTMPEAVNILKENGSANITLILRGNPKDSAESVDADVMDELMKKGVRIIRNAGVTRVLGEEAALTVIEYIDFTRGEKFLVDADTLIIGSGRFPELVFAPVTDEESGDSEETGDEQNTSIADGPLQWEGVELQKKPDAKRELGLLSDQDMISEYDSAVAAINGGRKAAAAIHNLMYKIPFPVSSEVIADHTMLQGITLLDGVKPSPRNIMEPCETIKGSVKGSVRDFSTGYSIKEAQTEAERCLRCGLVCYEKTQS